MDNGKDSERDSQTHTPPGYNPEDNPLFPDPRERNEVPTTSQPVDMSKVKVEATDQSNQENRPSARPPSLLYPFLGPAEEHMHQQTQPSYEWTQEDINRLQQLRQALDGPEGQNPLPANLRELLEGLHTSNAQDPSHTKEHHQPSSRYYQSRNNAQDSLYDINLDPQRQRLGMFGTSVPVNDRGGTKFPPVQPDRSLLPVPPVGRGQPLEPQHHPSTNDPMERYHSRIIRRPLQMWQANN